MPPKKQLKLPKSIKDFSNPKKMGHGKNASVRVQDAQGRYYQLKQPIAGQAFAKRVWAGGSDKENVGELAAACIVNAIVKPKEAHLFPEVLGFYHYKNPKQKKETKSSSSSEEKTAPLELHEKSIYIASMYLQGDPGGVKNLDEYMVQQLDFDPTVEGHVKFVAGESVTVSKREIGIDSPIMRPLIPSFCRALVFSAILGDHDVNPGNLMVVTTDGQSEIGRIDYGHGFNDLINTAELFGGGLRDQLHPVKDFINRSNVGGVNVFKQGSKSKLWRDYQGLVFTLGMADALMAAQEITDDQIREGVQEFISRVGKTPGTTDSYSYEAGVPVPVLIPGELGGILFQMDQGGSKEAQKSLLHTLTTMHEAITGRGIDVSTGKNASEQAEIALAKVGEAMARFIGKNRDDAVLTGRLMKAQLVIKEMVAVGFSTDQINSELRRQNLLPLDKCYLMTMTNNPMALSEGDKEHFKGNPAYILHNNKLYYIDTHAQVRPLTGINEAIIHFFPKGENARQLASDEALNAIQRGTTHNHPTIWIREELDEEPFVGKIFDYILHCRKEYCRKEHLGQSIEAYTPNLVRLYRAEQDFLIKIEKFVRETLTATLVQGAKKRHADDIWNITPAILNAISSGDLPAAEALIRNILDFVNSKKGEGFFDPTKNAINFLEALLTDLKALEKTVDLMAGLPAEKSRGMASYTEVAAGSYQPRKTIIEESKEAAPKDKAQFLLLEDEMPAPVFRAMVPEVKEAPPPAEEGQREEQCKIKWRPGTVYRVLSDELPESEKSEDEEPASPVTFKVGGGGGSSGSSGGSGSP